MSWEEDEEPYDRDWDEPDEYPARRLRTAVIKGVALVLVIGVLLALPLGYVLDSQIRDQHVEAVIAIVELAVMVVLVMVVRASRRSL